MAVLGKIRERSLLLIGIIGFALFAFIAEELFRSCESTRNEQNMRAGEVLGEKLDVNSFNAMVDEYTSAMKIMQNREDFSADELSQIRDMAWNQYVQNKVLGAECEKLGLMVTDKEMQAVLAEGTNPMLLQTPFVNQQTGKFDVTQLKDFKKNYSTLRSTNPQAAEQMKQINDYWQFIEKNLRQQILQQKYQALVAGCLLSNSVSEDALYKAENEEISVQLASFAYTSIKDDDKSVAVTDADIKAKYDEVKGMFVNATESRSISYVDYQITPSSADMAALRKSFEGYKAQLDSANGNVSDIVRKAGSLISYNGMPKTKSSFPADIRALIDSTAVGVTTAVKESKGDNTMNVVKILGKVSRPDSIEYRAIQIVDADAAKIATKADSVSKALKGGADFETIAKAYGQTGAKQWLTTDMYQNAPSIDGDNKKYIDAIVDGAVNDVQTIAMTNVTLVLQVTEKKATKEMYDVAVIKKAIEFSKETSTDAYNKFSAYVANAQNLEGLKKGAKAAGYEVKTADVTKQDHKVAGINSTSDLLKWIFNKDTNIGDMYTEHLECGDNGDHLMVAVLDQVNEEGFLTLDNKQVKEFVKNLAIKDKKAEVLMAKAAKCNSVDAAKAQGAKVSEVKQITFASPAFIQELGAQEPAISGAAAALAKGKVSKPIKGNAGVYILKVTDKKNLNGKKDKKELAQKLQQQSLMAAQQFMNELVRNANVKDNRYIFF
ncbi:MAG: SurA N-terminal domain-containing protein [Bacteroidaceae bacterium]|nr:SurA N-terminal domain-containing protein [Bacteroidaceae bacterium]